MTPREYARHMSAARKRMQAEHEREVALAWHIGAFVGAAFVGKLPEFRTVMARVRGTDQSHEELKQQILALSKVTGFPVKQLAAHGR